MYSKSILAAASTVLLLTTSASALTFSEPPDLTTNLAIPSNVGTLDIGANSISGSAGGFDIADAFEFIIPTGAELVSATLTLSNLVGGSVFTRTFTDLDDLFNVKSGIFDILGGTPLTGTQDYEVRPNPLSTNPISFDWRVDLTVAEINVVPVPAALPLLGAGLGMLGFMGWRRKATQA